MGPIRFLPLFILLCYFLIRDAQAQQRIIKVCSPEHAELTVLHVIARDKGYSEQEGLAVEIIAARPNLCTTALTANEVHFTSSPSTVDSIVAGRLRAKVIYVVGKSLLHRLIVSPNIKTFDDLKGKRIGIATFGTLTDHLTREILDQNKLRAMKDVILLQIGTPSVRYAALKSGIVDGVLLSSNQAFAALREGFRELKYDPPPNFSSPIIVKDEVLSREPMMVRSFIRATLKAHLFFGQKSNEAITFTQKALRISDSRAARDTYEDLMRRYNPGGGVDDRFRQRALDRIRDSLKVHALAQDTEIFDFSITREVQAQLTREAWHP